MKIRKATKKDLKEIGKLMLEEFSKPPFSEKSSIKSVLKSLNFFFKIGAIYLAEIKKEIAGAIVFKKEIFWEGEVYLIEDLAVKENFKGKGVGKKLMDFIESKAKKNKIKSIYFLTSKKSKAVEFYKNLGYKIGKNTISMGKKLKC